MKSSKKRRTTHHQSVTEVRNFTFSLAAVSTGSPLVVRRLFEVNSEPHTGARPSVRLCVALKFWRLLGDHIHKKNRE